MFDEAYYLNRFLVSAFGVCIAGQVSSFFCLLGTSIGIFVFSLFLLLASFSCCLFRTGLEVDMHLRVLLVQCFPPDLFIIDESGRAGGRAELLVNSGRRSIGQ